MLAIQFLRERAKMKALARAGIFFSLLLAGATANAGWSGNIGWQSDYYFRGIFQKSSSAQGGIDFEHNGFYVGTWAADVGGGSTGDGLEIDYYVGYGGEAGDFSYGIGYTGYTYTGDFDDTYQEINLSAGFSFVTLDIALGEYDNFDGPKLDYEFYSVTAEYNGFWGQYGTFDNDFDGDYWQVGYGTTISEIDFGLSLLYSDKTLVGTSEEALIFSIGKTFDIQ
jgi:uncharacterized protein (TIGR02001 family)